MDSVEPSKTPASHRLRNPSTAARRRRVEIRKFRVIATNEGFLEPASKRPRSSNSSSSSSTSSASDSPPGTSSSEVRDGIDISISITQKSMDPQPENGWHCENPAARGNSSSASDDGLSDRSTGTSSTVTTADGAEIVGGATGGDEMDRSVEAVKQVVPGGLVSSMVSSRSPGCVATDTCPPHGAVYICGRRREMEDAVAVVPCFMSVPCGTVGGCDCNTSATFPPSHHRMSALHFFGVYDGHGGSQVAAFCKEHLHRALEEEFSTVQRNGEEVVDMVGELKRAMVTTFLKVDAQVGGLNKGDESPSSSSFVAPETVGSTAVVAVVGSNRILVANCGDSRAVLSRGGRAIPLSRDHKPDQDEELARVEAAGGRVIFWNGYRVLGVLAMSRAIGDRYLKPFIIPEPDVTCIERSEDDECLILASDGLWDVVSNETVCEIARKCLAGRHRVHVTGDGKQETNADVAAGLLTKFAIAKGSADNISVVVIDLRPKRT